MTWRAVTLAVWGCLGAVLVAGAVVAHTSKGRWPDAGALFRLLTASALGRLAVIAGWMWLGWHVFAR